MSLKETEKFHKKKRDIPKVVKSTIKGEGEIIYGERALNARFPNWLDRPTEDFDVYSKQPRQSARQTEKALDKHFGGDYFITKPAQHKGTYKVVAKANQVGYCDYTKPEGRMPASEKIRGRRYVKLAVVKKHIQKTLKDPESKYRHAKDRDALNRIKIYENIKPKRKPKRKRPKIGFGWDF